MLFHNSKWFGPKPWGQICREDNRIPIPTTRMCVFCGERFADSDCGLSLLNVPWSVAYEIVNNYHKDIADSVLFDPYTGYIHQECLIANVVGTPDHQDKKCRCFTQKFNSWREFVDFDWKRCQSRASDTLSLSERDWALKATRHFIRKCNQLKESNNETAGWFFGIWCEQGERTR